LKPFPFSATVLNVMQNGAPPGSERIVTDYEAYLFGEGHWLRAWEKMGARPAVREGCAGYTFVVWAPNARGGMVAATR
jgi:1,4-alpha-glucan branching enzyme